MSIKKFACLLSLTFLTSTDVHAFVIVSGQTVGEQTITAPTNIGIVEQGGTITVTDTNAVNTSGANQNLISSGTISIVADGGAGAALNGVFNNNKNNFSVTNNGIISGTNTGTHNLYCVFNSGANFEIINRGTIALADNGFHGSSGIYNLEGANALIVNTGIMSVTSTFGGNGAILNQQATATILNYGSISMIGNGTIGLNTAVEHFVSPNSVMINYGTVSVFDNSSGQDFGLFNLLGDNVVMTNVGTVYVLDRGQGGNQAITNESSANVVITNSGLVSVVDESAGHDIGIYNDNASPNVVINNSGIVSVIDYVHNGTDMGIYNAGANVEIINSGIIQSNDYAIFISATNPTLSLLLGSNIQGPVHADTSTLNLNVQSGLNLALTLDAASVGFGQLSIRAPYALQNDPTIVVIDQTGLAMQSDMAADFSDSILNGLDVHRTCLCPYQANLWSEALGSYRTRGSQSQTLPYTDWLAGGLIGYDYPLKKSIFSLFIGYTYAQAQIQQSPQQGIISLGCAGTAYEWYFCRTFLGLSAVGAYVNWNNSRTVMNNLSPGGMDQADVDINGGFLTVEARVARSVPVMFCSPFLSFTMRYAGLFLGTYSEYGSLADLTVKNRSVGLLTTRLDAAFYPTKYCGYFEPFVGIYGRYQVQGSKVQGVLLGQSLYFDQEGPLNLVAGVIGIKGIQSTGLFKKHFNLEVNFDNASSTRVLGEIGLAF